ncbi:hypothetical protein, partial [Paraburkholderia madseniana]|uniref:hypothetical protein n=1 Tax=Paraburkholderia madseniana TaxID=2599607 RepID=UPI001C12DB7F
MAKLRVFVRKHFSNVSGWRMLTQSVSHVRQKGERVGPVEAFLVRRVEAVRLIVIGVQPDWHLRCVNAANGTSCWKVDGRLLDEIGRTSYVLERLLRVEERNRSRGRGCDPTLEVKVKPVTRFMLANEAIRLALQQEPNHD